MPNGACDAVISDFSTLKIIAIPLIVLWYNENQGKSPKRISSVQDEASFSEKAMEKISVVPM